MNALRIWCVLLLLGAGALGATPRWAEAGEATAPQPAAATQPAGAALPAGAKQPGGVPMIALNFADTVDVRVLAKWVSEVTNQTFAYDDSFQGTVMLEAPKEVPESALLPLFESILKLKGFALVRQGDLTMIVKSAAAPALDTTLVLTNQESSAHGTEFINQIVKLEHADPATVSAAIAPFLSRPDAVRVLADQNKLSISDYAENVRRALEVIAHLDQQEERPQVALLPLQFARASDLTKQLDTIFGKAKGAKGPGAGLPIFNADQRTNSVVIVCRLDELQPIMATLKTLDVPATAPDRPVHIYRLQNTQAEKIMPILDELLKGIQQKAAGEQGAQGAQPTPGAEAPPAGAPQEKVRGRDIQVVGDTENNALIVAATKEDHEWFAALVAELDQRRPQVLIEVWLVVVDENGARDLGVELLAVGRSGDATLSGGTFFGLTTPDKTTGVRTLPIPPSGGITLAILDPDGLTAVLNALETRHSGRIISRPRLLANANEKATFSSTHEEPFVTISAITASTSTTSFGGYQKAGTELTITPTILEGDYVYLQVDLSVSNFSGTAPSDQVPPAKDENRITTGVAVPNQAAIIIGGIVRDEDSIIVSKVPILGDIPLLGLLFRSKSTSTTHSTLYAFIRPRIFRAADFSDLKEASAPARTEAEGVEKTAPAVPGVRRNVEP